MMMEGQWLSVRTFHSQEQAQIQWQVFVVHQRKQTAPVSHLPSGGFHNWAQKTSHNVVNKVLCCLSWSERAADTGARHTIPWCTDGLALQLINTWNNTTYFRNLYTNLSGVFRICLVLIFSQASLYRAGMGIYTLCRKVKVPTEPNGQLG